MSEEEIAADAETGPSRLSDFVAKPLRTLTLRFASQDVITGTGTISVILQSEGDLGKRTTISNTLQVTAKF